MSKLNTFLITLIIALMLYPSFAQNNSQDNENQVAEKRKIELAIKNYKNALESDNLGATESAILNTMNLKFHYPDYDYSSLIQPLESLENNDESKTIRFMSYIVKNYLLHPERYAWMEDVHFQFDKDFYAIIGEKVSAQVSK